MRSRTVLITAIVLLVIAHASAASAPAPESEPPPRARNSSATEIRPGLLIPVNDGAVACHGNFPNDLTCYRVVEPAFKCVADLTRLLRCRVIEKPSSPPKE